MNLKNIFYSMLIMVAITAMSAQTKAQGLLAYDDVQVVSQTYGAAGPYVNAQYPVMFLQLRVTTTNIGECAFYIGNTEITSVSGTLEIESIRNQVVDQTHMDVFLVVKTTSKVQQAGTEYWDCNWVGTISTKNHSSWKDCGPFGQFQSRYFNWDVPLNSQATVLVHQMEPPIISW